MCFAAFPAIGALGTGATSGLFAASLGLNLVSGLAQRSAAQAAAQQTYQSSLIANRSAEQAFTAQQEAISDQLKETRASSAQEKLLKQYKHYKQEELSELVNKQVYSKLYCRCRTQAAKCKEKSIKSNH